MSKSVANVYGDLLDFCRKARLVFVNEEGIERSKSSQILTAFSLVNKIEWTSIRVFIRVQWEPFEASFGTIESSLRHHLEVLLHSAQADGVSERRRIRKREIRRHTILASFTFLDVSSLLV